MKKKYYFEADKFTYNKSENIVDAEGNVKILDKVNKYKIFQIKLHIKKLRKKFQQSEIQ